jgi:hypothetical protein
MTAASKGQRNYKFLAWGLIFGFIGLAVLAFTSAATSPAAKTAEAESTTSSKNLAITADPTASGGSYLEFKQEPAPPPPPPPTGKIRRFPGDPNPKLYNKAYWGAGIDGGGDPARHEDPTGKSLSLRRTFYQWSHVTNMTSSLYRTVEDDIKSNRLPFVSFKTPGWKAMGDGLYNNEIDTMLRKLDSYGKPVWLVAHHEPEGGGEIGNTPDDPGGPAEWRRMQIKIRERINAVGTKNIAFMPIVMTYTWNPVANRTPNDWWVEGIWDAYCVDHYAPSETTALVNKTWTDFVNWVEAKNMPYCIGEWGNRGIDAAAGQEMRDFWNWSFANKKDLLGYAYFDSNLNSPNGGWELKGEQLTVFQDILKNDIKVQRINDL